MQPNVCCQKMATFRCFSVKVLLNQTKCTHVDRKLKFAHIARHLSQSKEYTQDRDPAPLFFNNDIQNLLKSITRVDYNKVFKARKLGEHNLQMPVYKFMSDDELEDAKNEIKKKADEMLQMPPVVKVREPVNKILVKDPALKGLDNSKWIFTDISFGLKDTQRLVAIRDPDGTLREADWETKDRMLQIYFPVSKRKLTVPRMFEDPYLKNLLNAGQYIFVLDKACLQFEPNHPIYQKVTSLTYQHINENNAFQALRSTRHFGPFVFFLSWFKTIDNLLLELIETAHIEDAHTLVKLYGKIHNIPLEGENPLDTLENFISKYSFKTGTLELALHAYKEMEKEKQELEEGLKIAHGIK